ncbi:virulence RhuM family protein [Candidatus Sumerlaeota bacterium]|nr:virulence RhuM family protein [Candidatus Sumerlaeota bacterium]
MGKANPGNLPKKEKRTPAPEQPSGEVVLYRTEDGLSRIQVRLQDETVWLTQRALAELYEIATATVTHHVSSIYEERELSPDTTTRQYLVVQTEGGRRVRRTLDHYNLDMVLAIGYRVRSPRRLPRIQRTRHSNRRGSTTARRFARREFLFRKELSLSTVRTSVDPERRRRGFITAPGNARGKRSQSRTMSPVGAS